MAEIMETNLDNSPVNGTGGNLDNSPVSIDLKPVFHLD